MIVKNRLLNFGNKVIYQDNDSFDYHGTRDPLIGKPNFTEFTPKRITIIQMI